jgi:hypothetical protein
MHDARVVQVAPGAENLNAVRQRDSGLNGDNG